MGKELINRVHPTDWNEEKEAAYQRAVSAQKIIKSRELTIQEDQNIWDAIAWPEDQQND